MEIYVGSTSDTRGNLFSLLPFPIPLLPTALLFSHERKSRKFVAHDVSVRRNENATARLPISSPQISLASLLAPPFLSISLLFFSLFDSGKIEEIRSISSSYRANSPEMTETREIVNTNKNKISRCTNHILDRYFQLSRTVFIFFYFRATIQFYFIVIFLALCVTFPLCFFFF